MSDLINRYAAVEALCNACIVGKEDCIWWAQDKQCEMVTALKNVPSAIMYGYNIDHLMLIARALGEKDIPPENVADIVEDVGRILEYVIDSFNAFIEKTVKKQMPLPEPPKEKEK